jgi:hypothetical protein
VDLHWPTILAANRLQTEHVTHHNASWRLLGGVGALCENADRAYRPS